MNKSIWTGFGFLTGISYPLQAIKLLWQNRHFWQYLIIPIVVNIIVGITSYVLLLRPSLNWFNQTTNNLLLIVENKLDSLPEWLSFLVSIVSIIVTLGKVFLFIIIFVILGFIIVQFGGILGAPWYGKLSEKIEVFKTDKLELIELNIFHDITRAILFELKKIVLILVVTIPLLLLNLVPTVGNLVYLLGTFSLTITIVCLDFFDATLERRRLKFRQKVKFVMGGIPATIGFGLVCLGLITIPLLNLVAIPICVSAGTLFVCDINNQSKKKSLSATSNK